MRIFDHQGHIAAALPLPPISSVGELSIPTATTYCSALLRMWSLRLGTRFDAPTGKSVRTAMFETSPVKFDDAEVIREFAISKDGTRVPVNIVRRKGLKLDGNNPTLLEGYGGYGGNMTPYFLGSFGRIVARSGRGICNRQPAGRRRVRRRVAPGRKSDSQAKTCSTISSPAPNTSSSAIILRPRIWQFSGEVTGAC